MDQREQSLNLNLELGGIMFSKKNPVLTATMCSTMEMVRTTLEVLFGKRVVYVCVDFNTCRGKVRIGDDINKVSFTRDREDLLNVCVKGMWYDALFEGNLVRVGGYRGDFSIRKTIAGDIDMRWVGRSATDRWEEPLFAEKVEYCARVRGLTLEQLLNSVPQQ